MAATLFVEKGSATADQGRGFAKVMTSTQLRPGDTAMADPNSKVRIEYEDGCQATLEVGQIVTIDGHRGERRDLDLEQSPCTKTTDNSAQGQPASSGPAGALPPGAVPVVIGAGVLGWKSLKALGLGSSRPLQPVSP